MKCNRFLLVILAMFTLQAQAAPLVDRAQANWRWRPGITEASTPVTSWRVAGFDDSQFTTAPAPFWYDVTPDSSTLVGGTQITGMQNVYTSLFLRVTFVVTNTNEIAYLRLGALVDDGFVAWMNGTEVQRVNMPGLPGDPVSITSLANNAAEPVPFVIYTLTNPVPASYLVTGTNVLAVQVFQSTSATSSDVDFDASLESVLTETNPPTILSASPAGGGTVGGLTTITVTFSEPVSGVDAADFLINGVAATSVTPVSSTIYSFGFSQPAYGTVQITWNAGHGISDQALPPNAFNATGPGATWQYTLVDQTAPTVATLSPAAGATVPSLTNISVLFSEPVSGVDAADLRINNTPAASVVGTGDTYSFYFPQPAAGVVQVAWAAGHGIKDLAAAPNAFVAGGTWLYTLNTNAVQTGGPIISEFMAINSANTNQTGFYVDENGDSSDWIEIQNTGSFTVNLLNWSLTDTTNNYQKWKFPSTNLASGGFLVVFASGKDRRVAGARLHTSFQLSGEGEYLALVRPDGSIATEFAPLYPQQVGGVSYGLGVLSTNSTLVSTTSAVRVSIPSSGADGTNWLYVGFNDSGWTAGTNGVGFGATNSTQADYGAAVLATSPQPLVYYRMSETAGTTVANLGTMGASGNGTYVNSPTLGVAGPRPPTFNGFEANNNSVQLLGTANTDYVQGPAGLLTSRAAFTMAGWIRPTAAQAARTGLFGQNDTVEFGFISAGSIQAYTPNGGTSFTFAYPYPDNEWHHIAVVGASSTLSLYVDGTFRVSGTGAAGAVAGNFNIGGPVWDAANNDFAGQIDEVAMWDRALSASEVLGLVNAGTIPVGFSVVPFVKTDVGPAMSNVNASAYIRMPFAIDDPSSVQLLSLRMRYDDGFVAFINGIEVARANAPGALAYNSAATSTHSGSTAELFQFGAAMLRPGANVLAIQGLNITSNDADFLVSAELTATHNAAASGIAVYMTGSSPGTANGAGVSVLGPSIRDPTHSPNVPSDAQDVLVTARVTPTFAPIGSVVVRYRVMFGTDIELPMNDVGTNGDIVAGDGLYSCTLPIAAASTNGQMIRWYFQAIDTVNHTNRWPLFQNQVGEEYLGTIVDPTNVTSLLPIFHLFAAAGVLQTAPPTTTTGADGEAGGRVAIFYDGEFYDNVIMELRGNTSAGQAKKSHRLEFNREHPFRHLPGFPRVRKTSLMAEFLDPAYIRQHLSFWLLDQMGMKTPFFYPVRAQLNAQFYALTFHNDVIGQDQVERMGYDPKGALYKAAGNVLLSRSSTGVFQKLEPDEAVPNYTDYNQLVNGIVETATVANRRIAAFDMLDIPEVINYLAGARWNAENDDVWANMSLYRDTYGDQLWRIIPFDMNASWGQRYGGITPLDAIADTCKSHPLYGCSTIIACDGSTYNRIYDVIIALPETRQMLLRRQRTVLDRWVMEPGVPPESRLLETHIRYMTNSIWTEAFLDRAKWGYSTWTASNKPLTNAITELFNEFIALRRIHFSVTHNITNVAKPIGITPTSNAGIPVGQPPQASLAITAIEFNPASSNQLQEYICLTNPNPYAVDITGWKMSGGARFTFKPGTVMPSNGVLYVSPNVLAFKQRTTGPRGGQGLFVVGPYDGQLNARGESIVIHDDTGFLITSNSFIGVPSPAQLYLRITELMYNPSPLAGNTNDPQEFEYIELKNISPSVTLNLGGVRLTNGVEFNFTGSAVTSLAPGARVLVVKNAAAFAARYGALPNIAGTYTGALDSNGEVIRLDDATGEKILEFDFNNTWYPITDGHGFSLVIVDENAPWDTWGMKSSWRPSGVVLGSPGVVDPPPPLIATILVNEILTHSDLPLVDAVELLNPMATNVNIGGWFLTDDFTNATKYRFPDPTVVPAGGRFVLNEGEFNSNPGVPPSFAFSSLGDEVFLFSGNPATTNLTGYFDGQDFGAAESGVSFGRYTNSQGAVHFVAQNSTTFSNANALPKVGPVVVSEIMYRPPDLPVVGDNAHDEFIELANITGSVVPLFDPAIPTNTWRLRSAVDFDFPTNVTLLPGGLALVVGFALTNSAEVAAFRTKFNVPANVPLFGPWSGKLDNSADSVRLYKPDAPLGGPVPYVLVDRIDYADTSPWPAAADSLGGSLQRLVTGAYGNDVTNWIGAAPTGGSPFVPGNPPVITSQPVGGSFLVGANVTLSVALTGTPPFAYQWQLSGSNIAGANSAMLVLANVQTTQAGTYRVVVLGAGGSVESSNATLAVYTTGTLPPGSESGGAGAPHVTTHPQNQTVLGTLTAMFSVSASGTPPLSYQWVSGGTVIAGATNSTLVLQNVQTTQSGQYRCAIGNGFGYAVSSNATLTVLAPPNITQQPTNVFLRVPPDPAASPTNRAVFSVIATTANPPLTYRWRVSRTNGVNGADVPANDPNVTGIASNTLTISNLTIQSAGFYSCAVSDGNGTLTTRDGVLGVIPFLVEFPAPLTVAAGADISLSAVVQAFPPPFRFSWRRGTFTNANSDTALDIRTNFVTFNSTTTGYSNAPGVLSNSYILRLVFTNLATVAGGILLTQNNTFITVLADSDGDGVPDIIETNLGLNPNDALDGAQDLDGDRMSNKSEYLAGTDPNDNSSLLRIYSDIFAGNAAVHFYANSNRTYAVQYSDVVSSTNWLRLGEVLSRPTNRFEYFIDPAWTTNRFYRVVTPRQP